MISYLKVLYTRKMSESEKLAIIKGKELMFEEAQKLYDAGQFNKTHACMFINKLKEFDARLKSDTTRKPSTFEDIIREKEKMFKEASEKHSKGLMNKQQFTHYNKRLKEFCVKQQEIVRTKMT
jgi:hypothetical protein